MYKCAKTLMYLAFFTVIPLLLSACGGGASTDDASSQPSSVINKPEPSSISSSMEALALSSSSLASFSSASSAPSSTTKSSEQNYLRSSRASSSINSQSSTSIDVTPPTSTKLQLYRLSENSITLIWDDATDDAGISHYEISRNGVFIARVDYPSYMLLDQGLASYTSYNYTITAFDLTGNESGSPQLFTIRTLATSGGRSSRSSLDTVFNSSMANNSSKFDNNLSSSHSNASSKANISSHSNASSKANASSKSITASSKSSTSSMAEQPVTITWSHPNQRENGVFLELDEIGGYEIRYRKPTSIRYTYIIFNGNHTTEYTFPEEMQVQIQEMEFEIAVFDTAGLYSQFVKVTR